MEYPNRKPIRCKYIDYSNTGAYFITMCTAKRKKFLSNIVGAIHESPVIELLPWGMIVEETLNNLPQHLGVEIDQYVIMPDHVHMIIIVNDSEQTRAIRESPLQSRSIISKAIGFIKMNASKKIHEIGFPDTIWQRSYYDHVIRCKEDYEGVCKYIYENPVKWFYGAEEEEYIYTYIIKGRLSPSLSLLTKPISKRRKALFL